LENISPRGFSAASTAGRYRVEKEALADSIREARSCWRQREAGPTSLITIVAGLRLDSAQIISEPISDISRLVEDVRHLREIAGPSERLELSVKSFSRLKARGDSMFSRTRQRQFPSALPGTFIRASLPRSSRSCNGGIASAVGLTRRDCTNASFTKR
jgi:hypothetical protein